MSAPSPAYQYGRLLGGFQQGLEMFAAEVGRGFRDAMRPRTPEETAEAKSVRLYRQRIERERQQGLAHVRRTAARARRDLGWDS